MTKKLINLSDPKSLPIEFQNRLLDLKEFFTSVKFLEQLEERPAIRNLIVEINDYCLRNRIVGFHFTRAIPEQIRARGLLIRTGEEIRNNFINQFGQEFTKSELELIQNAWQQYFTKGQSDARNSKIFFAFTLSELNSGAKPLMRNYGGEQVYMPLRQLEGIGRKIESFGEPLILKCNLDPNSVKAYGLTENPWGEIAVSAYHKSMNSDARQVDYDGSQDCPILPKDVSIIKAKANT
jgi:hypothetical protein